MEKKTENQTQTTNSQREKEQGRQAAAQLYGARAARISCGDPELARNFAEWDR